MNGQIFFTRGLGVVPRQAAPAPLFNFRIFNLGSLSLYLVACNQTNDCAQVLPQAVCHTHPHSTPAPTTPLLRTPPTSLQFGGIAGLLKLLSLPVSRWVFGFISPLTCVCLHYWLLAGRLLFAAPLKPSICMYVPLSSCFSQASPSLLLMMRNLSLIFWAFCFMFYFLLLIMSQLRLASIPSGFLALTPGKIRKTHSSIVRLKIVTIRP